MDDGFLRKSAAEHEERCPADHPEDNRRRITLTAFGHLGDATKKAERNSAEDAEQQTEAHAFFPACAGNHNLRTSSTTSLAAISICSAPQATSVWKRGSCSSRRE